MTETLPKRERSFGCATLLAILTALGLTYWSGKIWLDTLIPEAGLGNFSLALDLLRPVAYLLVVGIPGILAVWLLKMPRFELWRGVGLAMAVSSLYALPLGILQAYDRQIAYPGLPDWLSPLFSVLISLGLIWWLRNLYIGKSNRDVIWLGLACGALVPYGYYLSGALGTPAESALALLDALSLALAGSILLCLPFYYRREYLVEQPGRAALLAGITLFAFAPVLITFRGFWIQGRNLAPVLGACGLLAGSLLVLDPSPQVRRTWVAVLTCLFMAMLPPLLLTDGLEGDWMVAEMSTAWSTAGYLAILIAFGLGGLLLILRDALLRWSGLRWAAPALAVLALVSAPIIYLASGGSSLQPETYLVVLQNQADTGFAEDLPDWLARRTAVYTVLTEHARQTQAGLRQYLDERQATYTPFYLVNALEVQGSRVRRTLASHPDVAYILDSPQARPLRNPVPVSAGNTPGEPAEVTWNIEKIEADSTWDQLSVTGEGIVIGIADSGVDATHPALADNYLGAGGKGDYHWYDPWEYTSQPVDKDGHGTGTTGIAVGQGGIGVAPGAKWIACRNLARNLGNPGDYLRCMQFLFAPFPLYGDPLVDGVPTRGAHLTSNSWGCPPQEGCDLSTLGIAVEHLTNAGQLMVVSAGNDGPYCNTVGVPANSSDSISVGSTDRLNLLSFFSSRGPAEDGSGNQTSEPDFVAPGEDVLSSWPGGYSTVSGTSFASPHVAGVIALMWSANPELIGDLETTREILAETSVSIQAQAGCGGEVGGQNNAYGYGLVNAFEAVKQALELAGK